MKDERKRRRGEELIKMNHRKIEDRTIGGNDTDEARAVIDNEIEKEGKGLIDVEKKIESEKIGIEIGTGKDGMDEKEIWIEIKIDIEIETDVGMPMAAEIGMIMDEREKFEECKKTGLGKRRIGGVFVIEIIQKKRKKKWIMMKM